MNAIINTGNTTATARPGVRLRGAVLLALMLPLVLGGCGAARMFCGSSAQVCEAETEFVE